MSDRYTCQWCEQTSEVIKVKQVHEGKVITEQVRLMINGETLYHLICKNCGTVIRSFVEDPDKLKRN